MIENDFFKITPYRSLIVAEFFGSWDIDVTREYLEEAFTIIRQRYAEKPYAVLDDFRGWELNTPDAIKYWKDTFAKTDIRLPTHVAYVVGDSGLKSWVVEAMTKEAISFEKAIFPNLHEGLKWLESKGYGISHPVT